MRRRGIYTVCTPPHSSIPSENECKQCDCLVQGGFDDLLCSHDIHDSCEWVAYEVDSEYTEISQLLRHGTLQENHMSVLCEKIPRSLAWDEAADHLKTADLPLDIV